MAYKIALSEMLDWAKSHPLLQKRLQFGMFGNPTWEYYLNIRNMNVTVFTVDEAKQTYFLSYYLKPFCLKDGYGITVGMPNNCPVAHDDACRNWRLLNKMFKCLVDQINDCADRANTYIEKQGA